MKDSEPATPADLLAVALIVVISIALIIYVMVSS